MNMPARGITPLRHLRFSVMLMPALAVCEYVAADYLYHAWMSCTSTGLLRWSCPLEPAGLAPPQQWVSGLNWRDELLWDVKLFAIVSVVVAPVVALAISRAIRRKLRLSGGYQPDAGMELGFVVERRLKRLRILRLAAIVTPVFLVAASVLAVWLYVGRSAQVPYGPSSAWVVEDLHWYGMACVVIRVALISHVVSLTSVPWISAALRDVPPPNVG